MLKNLSYIFFLCWFLIGSSVLGQDIDKEKLRVAWGVGLAAYHGDLCHGLDCYKPRQNIMLGVNYHADRRYSFRPELRYFRVQSGDENTQRNLSFRGDNLSFSTSLLYNFIDPYPTQFTTKKVVPYGIAGGGLVVFNPQALVNGEWISLQPLSTEGVDYSRVAFSIYGGLGTSIYISQSVKFTAELLYHPVFSDYLDDVSGTYVDNDDLLGISATLADRTAEGGESPEVSEDGEHWAEGVQRGDGKRFDKYWTLTFGIEFSPFGHKNYCPSQFWD